MSKWANWTPEELMHLGNLIHAGLTNKEIASEMGKSVAAISIKARRVWNGNPNYRKNITKHKHLHEPLLKYYLNHSAEECQRKFNLTKSEFKSCLTYAYKKPELKHLRKDTRRRDAWTAKEYRFLLAHAGLMPRNWIARKLNRGGHLGIKDRLDLLGISSQNLNGLTISKFRILFNQDPRFYLQTKAGPQRKTKSRANSASYYKIIPWVWIDQEIKAKRLQAPEMYQKMIASMAMFQEWIHGGNALRKMKRICNATLDDI